MIFLFVGYYYRIGFHNGSEVIFTLYKCSMKDGGFQWFISITPQSKEPGTTDDIDFYYAQSKGFDILPPKDWRRMDAQHVLEPAPIVTSKCNARDMDYDNMSNDGFDSDVASPPGRGRNNQMIDSDSDIERTYADALDDSFNSTYSEN